MKYRIILGTSLYVTANEDLLSSLVSAQMDSSGRFGIKTANMKFLDLLLKKK